MDIPAEFTLRIVRFVQEQHVLKSMVGWFFVPEWRHASWPEARELLAVAPKPLIVAALTEPGYIATWSLDDVPSADRDGAARHITNSIEYYAEKLEICGLREADTLVLDMPGEQFHLAVSEFEQWYREYAVSLGVTVQTTPTPHLGRVLVRPPGGGRPLGLPHGEP